MSALMTIKTVIREVKKIFDNQRAVESWAL